MSNYPWWEHFSENGNNYLIYKLYLPLSAKTVILWNLTSSLLIILIMSGRLTELVLRQKSPELYPDHLIFINQYIIFVPYYMNLSANVVSVFNWSEVNDLSGLFAIWLLFLSLIGGLISMPEASYWESWSWYLPL